MILKVPIVFWISEILLPLIIFLLPEKSPKIHLLLDTLILKEFNLLISTPMEPEEETMKLWQEELSLIQELLTNWLILLDQILFISPQENNLLFLMLPKNILKEVTKPSFLLDLNTEVDHPEIGLPKDLTSKDYLPLLLKVSKESIEAI